MNITKIKELSFIQKLQQSGGEVFVVGGIVRDQFLGKDSKDIDLIVRKLEIHKILEILQSFGTPVETTIADKFGVIKFVPTEIDLDEPIDIALPRVERMMTAEEVQNSGITNAYNAFVVNSNPMLPIEDDLKRRDFTINSIAFDLQTGKFIDPFGGIHDIQKRIIRHTNDEAFNDDPLRMFRAIQFVSRFEKFKLDDTTFEMIRKNSFRAKEVAAERILGELTKIFEKGDISKGIKFLRNSDLHGELFKTRPFPSGPTTVKTKADFFFQICGTSEAFTTVLKGDTETAKGIKAIEKILESFTTGKLVKPKISDSQVTSFDFDMAQVRLAFFDALQISESILESGKVPAIFKIAQQEFVAGQFPHRITDLAINGFDIMNQGLKGKEIGFALRKALTTVMGGTSNAKQAILEALGF
jgi:tRNA nucleotidyltransferase/poly(A) polymerase